MKTLLYCCLAALLLTAARCATVGSYSIKLTSKQSIPFDQPIHSVYLEVNGAPVGKDEEMYMATIKGFKKSLLQKGVAVREDFTGEARKETIDRMNATFQPDAWLVLGRPFKDAWEHAPLPGMSRNIVQSKVQRQRFNVQLINPATKQVIWVGEVSFQWDDALYVGERVVRDWTATGLLAPVMSN